MPNKKNENPPAHYKGSLIDWKALSARQQYCEQNKDAIRVTRKVYRETNRDAINTQGRAYYHENSDTIMEQQRNYRIRKANEFYALHGTYEIEPGIY